MSASRNKPEEEFLQKQRPVKGVLKGLCRVCIFLKMMSQVEKQNLKGKVIELKNAFFKIIILVYRDGCVGVFRVSSSESTGRTRGLSRFFK